MTGPDSETEGSGTRPISVAELLAKNGTIGAPAVTRRRRRRRGDDDAVTVAELTGEIPVVGDDDHQEAEPEAESRPATAYWSEPEPRWPKSPPPPPQRASRPERSEYPRPVRRADVGDAEQSGQSGAEDMSPDPMDDYADGPVDLLDAEVSDADAGLEDSAYVRSFLRDSDSTLFGGQTLADEVARRGSAEKESPTGRLADEEHVGEDRGDAEADRSGEAADVEGFGGRVEALWRGGVVVLQSVLAVVFGAGLFVAFDQLWRWNSIVALVLSVLVILGLVVGVRVVRKTEDIASTLIAVAVGALITLGPLALSLQSG
ncbi:MAG: hypothetical protein ACXVYI_04490 [Mycobacterium sp.]